MKKIFFVVLLFNIFFSCKKSIPPQTRIFFDTVCTVNLFDDGSKILYDEIFSEIDRLQKIFDVHSLQSEISKINSLAGISWVSVSNDMIFVLNRALKIANLTEGAFNPAMEPLINLWAIGTEFQKVPQKDLAQKTALLCDFKKIEIDQIQKKIFLQECGMGINLGGAVKGYAADKIVEILKMRNVKKAIVDLGGNIYAFGKKSNGEKWKIAIKNPQDKNGKPILRILCDENSIVTSGAYERFFESDGKIFHHIFDSKTGFPCESGLASASVISKSSLDADILSTATFVMGEKKSLSKISELEAELETQLSFILIDNTGKFFASQLKPNILLEEF